MTAARPIYSEGVPRMLLRDSALIFVIFMGSNAIGQATRPVNRGPANRPEAGLNRSQLNQQSQRQMEYRSAGKLQSFARETERLNRSSSRLNALPRQFERPESIRNLSPEKLQQHARTHANLHAQLASGLQVGRPVRLDEKSRQAVAEIFGNADLLDPRQRPGNAGSDTNDSDKSSLASRAPLPVWNSNPRARLTNAIRVRRAQISEIRDRAIETGNESLLTQADRMEQKLDIFLYNQERVEANLNTVGERIARRNDTDSTSNTDQEVAATALDVQLQDLISEPTNTAIEQPELITDDPN